MYYRGQELTTTATNINKDRTSLRKLECVLSSYFMIKASNLAEAPEAFFLDIKSYFKNELHVPVFHSIKKSFTMYLHRGGNLCILCIYFKLF